MSHTPLNNDGKTSKRGLYNTPDRLFFALRLVAGALGIIFLAAAISKASDMELFIRQIREYGIISQYPLLVLTAWGVIILECALGTALILGYHPRLTLPFTVLLFLVFLGVTVWAWINGSTEDCGCFGAWIQRTPGQAVIEDLVLLAVTGLVWLGYRYRQMPKPRSWGWAIVFASLVGFVLPMAFGFSLYRINIPQLQAFEVEFNNLEVQGLGDIDLNNGAYLITLMDTECMHCKEIVPELNILAEETDSSLVIALCANDEEQRAMFIEEFQPEFPIGRIKENIFWRLMADADMPRIVLVSDGRLCQIWDQIVPDREMIETALDN